MPLIRHSLSLTYVQVGLLAAVPFIAGSLIELPLGVLSGAGARRRKFILGGGLLFVISILGAGLAQSFGILLAALIVFFPASGAFVGLTQASLMDADPGRRAQHMARWTLAGSGGAVAGALLLAVVLWLGGSWRTAFIVLAASAACAWLGAVIIGKRPGLTATGDAAGETEDEGSQWPGWRAAGQIIRRSGALRWLVLLQVSDLLLDVLTTFLALYLVASVHASPSVAALSVALRLGAGLAGDVLLIRLLERFDGRRILRVSVLMTCVLFPAFLLVPGLGAKLAVLTALTVATAPWFPVLSAELYGSLPGRSGLAVSLSSASGLVGGLGPLIVGFLAQSFGLNWAMAVLCAVPVLMLAVPRGSAGPGNVAQSGRPISGCAMSRGRAWLSAHGRPNPLD